MEHCRSKSCRLWTLCLLVLIAGGCRGGGASDSTPSASEKALSTLEILGKPDDERSHGDAATPVPRLAGSAATEPDVDNYGDTAVVTSVAIDEEGGEDKAVKEKPAYGILKNIPEDYRNLFDIVVPSIPKDKVVIESLVFDAQECVARGFIHNLSDSMFARNVLVALESLDGDKRATWHWPLSVMPGERAPFEIQIDWVAERLPTDDPNFWIGKNGIRSMLREPLGNITHSVTYDLSTDIDISRAFATSVDRSELEREMEGTNSPFSLWIFDERLYGLDDWEKYFRLPDYFLISRDSFNYVYPDSLLISDDLDSIASRFIPLIYSDLYYIPERVFPQYFNDEFYGEVNDIRVFQADIDSNRILDVRELIPFKVIVQENETALQRKIVATQLDFINFDSENFDADIANSIYILRSRNQAIYTEKSSTNGIPKYSSNQESQLWIGKAVWMESLWPTPAKMLPTADRTSEERGWITGSCDRSGGLTRENFEIVSGVRRDVFDVTFGYHGFFKEFQSFPEVAESIFVDTSTVAADDGFVRGLVHNASDHLFARDLTVRVSRDNVSNTETSWSWPLTLQPGERAPFEVFIGGWEGDLSSSEFTFKISTSLSERVDISRSFWIHDFGAGSVYAGEMEALLREGVQGNSYDYESYVGDHIFTDDYRHITREAFEQTYGQVACFQSTNQSNPLTSPMSRALEESCHDEQLPFAYVDLYAQISIPDSHPTLSGPITTQVINDLQAYVAILDEDRIVKDVKEVALFTSGYSSETGEQEYISVDRIPTPNLTNPGGVRLLFTRPQFNRSSWWNGSYDYQVWIGGANS